MAGPINFETGDFDPGSFRDPASRVVLRDGVVARALTEHGRSDWDALAKSGLLEAWQGRLVSTELASDGRTLVHEKIPFWTYPYEWSFAMLKRAALFHLELNLAALERGLDLKDATPYNIQFVGQQPVFVDLGSFRPYRQGDPWIGYGQFCRLFLYPLLIQSYAGISFQPLLRGSLEGVDPETANAMLRGQKLRPGVALDVALQARTQRKTSTNRDVRGELGAAGFKPEMITANLKRLTGIVSRLEWSPDGSTWAGYTDCAHVASQRQAKADFVSVALGERRRQLVWDLGANDGHFSRLAAEQADLVLAADADHLVIDRLYADLVKNGPGNVLPIVFDLSNPSPGLGWRGRERRRLEDRGQPDLVLLLAVMHHLVVAGNLPLAEVVSWLDSLRSEVVFEWVPPTDPMAKTLSINKRAGEIHPDYNEESLRTLLDSHFSTHAEKELEGRRILFHLVPR